MRVKRHLKFKGLLHVYRLKYKSSICSFWRQALSLILGGQKYIIKKYISLHGTNEN